MTAVLSGKSDIGFAGPEACIYVMSEGRDSYPQIFAQMTKRDGAFLVGREDVDFQWSDMEGKTVIGGRVGGVPEMTLEYVMRQNGLEPQVDAIVDTATPFDMMAGAFTGGSGDYVTLFEPTATMMEEEGKGYVLASIGEESGEIPYTAYFANQDFMAENEDLIQAFTNAVAKGLAWVQEATAEEIAEAIAPQFPDTDVELLAKVAQRYKDIDAWCSVPMMTEESFDRLQTVMEQAGQLEEPAEYDTLVNNSYAEKAVQ